MDKKFDVTIVGLGPVGSLLALLLNKAGYSSLRSSKPLFTIQQYEYLFNMQF